MCVSTNTQSHVHTHSLTHSCHTVEPEQCVMCMCMCSSSHYTSWCDFSVPKTCLFVLLWWSLQQTRNIIGCKVLYRWPSRPIWRANFFHIFFIRAGNCSTEWRNLFWRNSLHARCIRADCEGGGRTGIELFASKFYFRQNSKTPYMRNSTRMRITLTSVRVCWFPHTSLFPCTRSA